MRANRFAGWLVRAVRKVGAKLTDSFVAVSDVDAS
jgi:tmRNA-binding protein